MSIHRQLSLSGLLAAALVLLLLFTLLVRQVHEQQDLRLREQTDVLRGAAVDMRSMTVETVLYNPPRVRGQWAARTASLQAELTRSVGDDLPEWRALLRQIGETADSMDVLYQRLGTVLDHRGQGRLAADQEADLVARTVTSLLVTSKQILDFTDQLTKLRRARRDSHDRWMAGVSLAVAIAMAGVLVLLVRLMQRRVLGPMRVIEGLTARIAVGDLSGRSAIAGSDEMSAFGAAFDNMCKALNRSRASLTAEIALRTESEARLGIANQALGEAVVHGRQANQKIAEALAEKEVMLGEIHHRVKNNLQIIHSLLDMQAGLTEDAIAAAALRDSRNRIQSMALIHQTLYQSHDYAKVEFGSFLDNLVLHLHGSYARPSLKLTAIAARVQLPIDQAIPCGLIINELVTNALKHGFPDGRAGSITVELRVLDAGDIEISVTDDGIGLPEAALPAARSSLGMQLVHVLTAQLHTELTIHPRCPTRFAFTLPRP